MRRLLLLYFACCCVFITNAQTSDWKMVEGKISSPWAAQVNPAQPLPEYPRPQMVRDTWLNLNGLWEYAIVPEGTTDVSTYQGEILVPFAIESALSGVGKTVGEANNLVYRRSVSLPSSFRRKKVLLHFGEKNTSH